MYDVKEILSALQEGQKPEDIGAMFANALNEAIAEKQRLEEAEKANLKAQVQKAEKLEAARDLIWAIIRYIEAHTDFPELGAEMRKSVESDEEVEEMCGQIENVVQLTKSLFDLKNLTFPKVEAKVEKSAAKVDKGNTSPDDVLRMWIETL